MLSASRRFNQKARIGLSLPTIIVPDIIDLLDVVEDAPLVAIEEELDGVELIILAE